MKNILRPWIIIAFFLTLNFGLILKYNALKKDSITSLKEQSTHYNYYLELYNDQLFQEYINNGTELGKSVFVNDPSGCKYRFQELFNRSPKLIVRFSELGCSICFEEELLLINEYLSVIGGKNVIILTDHNNVRRLFNFKQMNNIKFDVFTCENIGLPFEMKNKLYLFVCDSTLIVKHFFIPEKTLPKLSRNYYSAFCKKYYPNDSINKVDP